MSKRKPGSEFICDARCQNRLPSIPFPSKLRRISLSDDEFSRHVASAEPPMTLAQRMPYPLEIDLRFDMPIDLVRLGAFSPPAATTHPVSEVESFFLDDPVQVKQGKKPGTPSKLRHAASLPFLRRTEYLSDDVSAGTRKSATGLPRGGEPLSDVDDVFSNSSILNSIERSFRTAADTRYLQTLRHPTKPHLTPVAQLPVFPDFRSWGIGLTLCVYGDQPDDMRQAADAAHSDEGHRRTGGAVLRPLQNPVDPDDTFLAYYLPTAESIQKEEQQDDGETAYEWVRDLSHESVRSETMKQLLFVLHRGDDAPPPQDYTVGAFYSPVSTRLLLRRHCIRNPSDQSFIEMNRPTRLRIRRREPTADETATRQSVLNQILG